MTKLKYRVLILCTGNSCRSQMAEVLWAEHGKGSWEVCSAGSEPTGSVHPVAIEVIKERGLPVDGLRSKSVNEFADQYFDVVVTVCSNAKDSCPDFSSAGKKQHWPFADPALTEGKDEEIKEIFKEIFRQIEDRISSFLEAVDSSSTKSCERCGEGFTCSPYSIEQCQCASVELSEKQRSEMSEQYGDCLCVNCLTAIAAE